MIIDVEDIYDKYYLNKERRKNILEEGIIIFDTSVLLQLYNYSADTQKYILEKIFDLFNGRLWIPAQVKFEYLKNRERVANQPIDSYKNLLMQINEKKNGGYITTIMRILTPIKDKNIKDIKNELNKLRQATQDKNQHPYFNQDFFKTVDMAISHFEDEYSVLKSAITTMRRQIEEVAKNVEERINEYMSEDEIRRVIDEKIEVGAEYEYLDLMKIVDEGKSRYENKIPPGYEDVIQNRKAGLAAYGDLILWKQILDYGNQIQKPVLLVINEVKGDWIDDRGNPRYELLKEFNSYTKQSFWLYSFPDLLNEINNIFPEEMVITQSIISEVKKTNKDREKALIASSYCTERMITVYFENNIGVKIKKIVKINEIKEELIDYSREYIPVDEIYLAYDINGKEVIIAINSSRTALRRDISNGILSIAKFMASLHSVSENHDTYLIILNENRHRILDEQYDLINNMNVNCVLGYIEEEQIIELHRNFPPYQLN